MTLTEPLHAELEGVNREINALPYRADIERYGRPEFWAEVDQDGGDCEDFARRKRHELLQLGWPPSALRLATCWDEMGGYHAVLTVDTDRGTLVLDNRFPRPERWEDLSVHGYRWDRRQAGDGGRGWVAIAA